MVMGIRTQSRIAGSSLRSWSLHFVAAIAVDGALPVVEP